MSGQSPSRIHDMWDLPTRYPDKVDTMPILSKNCLYKKQPPNETMAYEYDHNIIINTYNLC